MGEAAFGRHLLATDEDADPECQQRERVEPLACGFLSMVICGKHRGLAQSGNECMGGPYRALIKNV